MNPPRTRRARMEGMPVAALEQVASYFQALSEPTRLQILNFLRRGERNVGDLARLCGFTAANVSRHLTMLAQCGLVVRESRGTSVYYRIADRSVYDLCDAACGNVARQVERTAREGQAFVPTDERPDATEPVDRKKVAAADR
jgi:DNA-binding transcriptional ArsR family regulator